MNRAIYFPALIRDIKQFFQKRKHLLFHQWTWVGMLFVIFALLNDHSEITFTVLVGLISVITTFYIARYLSYRKKRKEGKLLSFQKKKNERVAYFYWFLSFLVLSWIINFDPYFTFFLFSIACFYLLRVLLYIPSIIFMVHDDELTILRKHKSKQIDFSYPNRLRFHNNRLLFIHPIEGQITWKDINMNRDTMSKIQNFLADNFGKEMVLNPTTGLPYVN